MLNALEFQIKDSAIEVGVFKSSEVGKADGHNNHSGTSQLPLRRFIPTDREEFTQEIMSSLRSVVDSEREDRDMAQDIEKVEVKKGVSISVQDILGRSVFDRLFGDGES
jgi:hypothetical protein